MMTQTVKRIDPAARIAVLILALLIAGCNSIGPVSVTRDRFDYNTAISRSWKEQTLLNIVKLRYADMPLFVEVASIVSGYTLESTLSLSGTKSNSILDNSLTLGGSGKFVDRPTITYVPITGAKFNKSVMTPIPPGAILFLMQSGWPADMILPLTVDSANGLRSQAMSGVNQRAGDADYYRVIELIRQIQLAGGIGMRIKKADQLEGTTIMFFQRESLSPETQEARQELFELLGLQPELREVPVNYGLIAEGDNEIVFLTRSMLGIMSKLAIGIDVPAQDIADGRTIPTLESTGSKIAVKKLMNIEHSVEKPDNAFVAAKYRDHWFWVDDRDFDSKRAFTFLMILFSLTETGGREGLPLVTIPAS